MVGAYRVVIQNKKIKFDFEIRRNITILRGDSATGKTTLVEMIREYEELGPDSGIELQCEKDCVVLSGRQTEDSNSGYQFFRSVCTESGIDCKSARGKSNIFKLLLNGTKQDVLVIADGAAFGSQMERIMDLVAIQPNFHVYLPESFEWLILQSGLLEDGEINDILESPEKYVDSLQYFSWERFFTALLTQRTSNSYLSYTKSKLNPVYLQEQEKDAILSVIPKVQFKNEENL